MCGIVGVITPEQNSVPLLIKGLKRLEYRGYDSAGVAIWDPDASSIACIKQPGKVKYVEKSAMQAQLSGHIGIAHTRWATHGEPNQANAHPHTSHDTLALVHNGIIENAETLKHDLIAKGYAFSSDTDTEVIAHLLHDEAKTGDFTSAIIRTCAQLEGSYALLILHHEEADALYAISHKSPLMMGVDDNGHCFVASDALALSGMADRGFYLASGQVARGTAAGITLVDASQQAIDIDYQPIEVSNEDISMGQHKHFMHKEIYEQPQVIRQILSHYYQKPNALINHIPSLDDALLQRVQRIHIVGCGTSFYSGLIAKYWFESSLGLPVTVTLGSEFHYHKMAIEPNTLLIALSQSGETADTLESIRNAQSQQYIARLAICNVTQSSMVKDCDAFMPLLAGPEIGVASTKAFTAQLMALFTLGLALGQCQNKMCEEERYAKQAALFKLPSILEQILSLEDDIETLAHTLLDSDKVLFLGRNLGYPTALEGALKLKEISYIHAHAYPSGELKHGPLALIDDRLYLVALLPNDHLVAKNLSNLQEVQARGGRLLIFHQGQEHLERQFPQATFLALPKIDPQLNPFPFTVALQLLAYHVARIKGLDVDKPRNLAKSVTVE